MWEFNPLTYTFCPPLTPDESKFVSDIFEIGQKIKDQDSLKKLLSRVIFKVKTIEN